MSYFLTDDELAFRDAIGQFARDQIKPLVRKMDLEAQMDPNLIKQFFEMGLMGIESPEKYGGAGSNFFMACLAVEEISKVDASCGVLIDVQNTLVTNALLKWGNESQKQKYLSKMAKEWVGAYCLSESGSGSDAFALQCRAEKKDGRYILNGHKLWITNANEASIFIVFATIDKNLGYKGITAFLVEKGMKGFSVGKKEDKLGIRASSTCELLFDQCEVPAENVLGEVGHGYKTAIETLNEGRIGIGAQMIGVATGALTAAIEYAKTRKQFGKPISAFQAVQFQLAEAAVQLEAARLMVYNSARLKDAKKPFLKEAAMAKLFSSRVAEKICSVAIEVFGGNGFTKEYPVEKFYRDAKIGQIYEGTSNMQLQTIAKSLLE